MSGRYLLDTSILIALFADEMAVNLYSLIRSPFVDGHPIHRLESLCRHDLLN